MGLRATIYARQKGLPFVSTWKTDNTSTGSSTATQVKLPLVSAGTYNFIVDWGDGNTNTITTWNQAQTTHTYSVAGTYTIKIKGVCTGWQFNNTGDRLKFLSVKTWGSIKLGTNQGGYFNGCANLNLSTVEDVLKLTGTTSLLSCFSNCSSLASVGRMNEWDTSGINSMAFMFQNCTNFNSNISNWDTSNVTEIRFMFSNASSFNQNLGGWNVTNCSSFDSTFNGAGTFNNGGSPTINNWIIKSTGTVDMNSMFFGAGAFNQPLGLWNVSAVILMNFMFQSAGSFNQNIGSWNVSNVTGMANMFANNGVFNNGLANGVAGVMTWNTINVTSMSLMFQSANAFNQDISGWNVSKVSTFASMFRFCAKFNNGGSANISNWVLKTTGTIDMSFMFGNTAVFNSGLANGVAGSMLWNFSNVTSTANMFNSASAFNQNLGTANFINNADFTSMFQSAGKFNNGGSTDINSWTLKTTGTINFAGMFNGATALNQALNVWDTSAVNNMNSMFQSATAFNQDIGSWNISNVTSFTNFMTGKTPATFSTANLDSIYNGWSSRPVKTPITITFGTAKYTAAGSAGKAILQGAGWTITDGGI